MKIDFAKSDQEEADWFTAWGLWYSKQKQARESGDLWATVSAARMCSMPRTPEWVARERESQYRKGFEYGWLEAAQFALRLYAKGGYVRPREICNLLFAHCEVLRKWRIGSLNEQPLALHGEPLPKQMPWKTLRSEAFTRDGMKCVRCGSASQLEAHHVEPVSDGGLPVLNNLETLCFQCHRGCEKESG